MYNRSHRLYSSSDEDMARAPKVTAHPKAPTVPSPATERTPELHRPVRPRAATPTTSGAATTVSPGAYSGKSISITEVCTV